MSFADYKQCALSFTGGKDSILALHKSIEDGLLITLLVTFSPSEIPEFKAHKFELMQLQAQALGIPYVVRKITGPDYLHSYREQITLLHSEYRISSLVTGDILDISNNFMSRAVEGTGVDLVRPLWQLPRTTVLEDIWLREIDVIITCIAVDRFVTAVQELIQPTLEISQGVSSNHAFVSDTDSIIQRLVGCHLNREFYQTWLSRFDGVDACGEYGEYHTMCVDCPLFKKKIIFPAAAVSCVSDGVFAHLEINFEEISLTSKS